MEMEKGKQKVRRPINKVCKMKPQTEKNDKGKEESFMKMREKENADDKTKT